MKSPRKDGSDMRLLIAVRMVAWALAATIVILSVVPVDLRPETPMPHDLEHFGIFLLTGVAYGLGYRGHPIRLAIVLVAYCALVEIAQLFMPGRHARLSDFVVDALAVCAGVVSTLIWFRLRANAAG